MLPRVLVTIGALATIAPFAMPIDDHVELVDSVQSLIDGKVNGVVVSTLALVLFAAVALLAWLPAPSSGGAKPIAWLVMAWPFFMFALLFVDTLDFDLFSTAPASAIGWIAGSGTGLGVAYFAILGYGAATLIGKQLERG
jgi:hypothetical protein